MSTKPWELQPEGLPGADCWRLERAPVAQLTEGQVRVATDTVSIDPAMRAWMEASCYVGCVGIDETMWAFAAGEVIDSRHPGFAAGDRVRGFTGVQRYATVAGDELERIVTGGEPLSWHLGLYGNTGLTAYFGITDLVTVAPGQQVLVSSAGGAVGSVVAQLAKLRGARVVGIAGGRDKCDYCIDEYGLDACVDYKAPDFTAQLDAALPSGVDIYFDNVGVPILDEALRRMNERGTVIVCGAINQFQHMENVSGPREYLKIPERKLAMLGFTVFHYRDRYAEGVGALRELVVAGKLRYHEDTAVGLEHFPSQFDKLFSGAHRGKLCIRP